MSQTLENAVIAAEPFGLWQEPPGWDAMDPHARDAAIHKWLSALWGKRNTDENVAKWFRVNAGVARALEVANAAKPKPTAPLIVGRPSITTRNLIYHVCPIRANNLWRQNVAQLVKRADVFNGRRIIAVAYGEGLEQIREVQAAFAGHGQFEFLRIPNDKQLREVISFLPLLAAIHNTDGGHATFYAHTKGNSTDGSVLGSIYWRNMMYARLLDDWQLCMDALRVYAAAGCLKMVWPPDAVPPYPSGLRHGHWMFSGTYFWFRHDRVFGERNWRNIAMDRYGAESWLSGMFAPHACLSVYQKWPEDQYPTPSPYEPALYAGEEIPDDPL